MRTKFDRYEPVVITFKTANGNTWEESHSSRLLRIFKQDPTVLEIRNKETDELIYKREE